MTDTTIARIERAKGETKQYTEEQQVVQHEHHSKPELRKGNRVTRRAPPEEQELLIHSEFFLSGFVLRTF